MNFTPILLLFFLHFIYLAEGLKIRDLDNVIQKLEDAQFNKADWEKLGRKLGLHPHTLDMINANKRGDVDKCFTECLVKWLSRADDVDSKCNGKPSFSSLADALDQMGSKNEADYIRGLSEGKKPAKRQKLDPGTSTKKCGSDYKYNDGESEACAVDEETDGPPQGDKSLDISDLSEIVSKLKECKFDSSQWEDLCLDIGLYEVTISTIRSDRNSANDRLRSCLVKWLNRVEDVDKKGGATWESLENGLINIGQKPVAEKLRERRKNRNK